MTCPKHEAVTFELSSEPYRPEFPELVPQALRAIPARIPQFARSRRVPCSPPAAIGSAQLAWEYEETGAFKDKILKKDPRLRPSEVQLNFEHLDTCQSCKNYKMHHESLHARPLDVGTRPQLLVDDLVVERWSNLVRFLNSPIERRPVLRAPAPSVGGVPQLRFGCPCSVVRDATGYRLWHTANGQAKQTRVNDKFDVTGLRQPSTFVRHSSDGLSGWSEPVPVTLDGKETTGTFAATSGMGAPGSRFVAGYEGNRARACLASSVDGTKWVTMAGKAVGRRRMPDCWDNSHSFLGRAADTYVQPLSEPEPMVWYRRDFGTPGGWREIRGVHIVSLGSELPEIAAGAGPRNQTVRSSWYLDRLGKLERFRRQIYSVLLTPMGDSLWLGLMTVIEWPKDMSEPTGNESAAPERDTTNVYLVTSRDGIHIDDEWIYAHRPLIPKGRLWRDWDGGFVLPAAQIVTDETSHRVYYEARSGSRHEERFDRPGTIAMASWDRDRLVGVRAAHEGVDASLTTKAFELRSLFVVLNADTSESCSSIAVEVLEATLGKPLPGLGLSTAVPLQGVSATRATALWRVGDKKKAAAALRTKEVGGMLPRKLLGQQVKLRFNLHGGAKLYGFAIANSSTTDSSAGGRGVAGARGARRLRGGGGKSKQQQ